ncbi:hypothetical protein Cni_G13100 [Canna indica]|uniref:Uncharacterized protein n=1 Tax=Canna indica TaxID=4628 RepID=A0AAQ3QB75_9LILI|nr:hypothetical protein Cni_G13100 [Canna indica]
MRGGRVFSYGMLWVIKTRSLIETVLSASQLPHRPSVDNSLSLLGCYSLPFRHGSQERLSSRCITYSFNPSINILRVHNFSQVPCRRDSSSPCGVLGGRH